VSALCASIGDLDQLGKNAFSLLVKIHSPGSKVERPEPYPEKPCSGRQKR
jgi:hypothetical protein